MLGRKKEDSGLAFDISKFDKDEQNEIQRIKTFLEAAEVIKAVARQSKFMPGGKLITPRTIFATDKRVLIRDPNSLGIRAELETIPYSQINKVNMTKGAFTSEIRIESGQFENDEKGIIPAIPKKKAANIIGIINEHLREAQHFHGYAPPPAQADEDPLTLLKKRFVKGEISQEEFESMKEVLE